MAIYKIKNYGSGKCLNISGSNVTSLTNNQNVTQWDDSGTNEQKWAIDSINTSSTNAGVPIKSNINTAFSINIYRTTKNCDVYPSASNGGGDGLVYFVPVAGISNGYNIATKSTFSTTRHVLSLTTNNSTNGTNVCWSPAASNNYQVWILEEIGTGPVILNGWLKLYKSPTSSKTGRVVNIPTVSSYTESDGKTYAFTNKNNWYAYENPYGSSSNYINPYAYNQIVSLTGKAPVVNIGSNGEYTDANGNYWMAVGPNVVNPSHTSAQAITAAEMYGKGKLDIVVKDSAGTLYYIPAVVGDAKAHTWSNGIIQTWKSYPSGTFTSAGSNYNGTVCAEFMGSLGGKLSGLGNYSVVKIIFY